MGRLTKIQLLQHNRKKIIDALDKSGKNVFSLSDLSVILEFNKRIWGIAYTTKAEDFINFIVEKKIIDEVKVKINYRDTKRYTYKNASKFEIASSLRKDSYISHYSAMFIHGLTNNIVKNIYTNLEQSKKPSNSREMLQENIDKVFLRPMRLTNNIAKLPEFDVYLLNGKYLERLEVIDYLWEGKKIPVTSIERTLIDIAIRPNYAGNVHEVLKAFKMAKDKFSVNRLISTLKKMNYIYPYHQVIGFYLEKAGYEKNLLKLVENLKIKYKFYLNYQINNKEFSTRWNLYYPGDL